MFPQIIVRYGLAQRATVRRRERKRERIFPAPFCEAEK